MSQGHRLETGAGQGRRQTNAGAPERPRLPPGEAVAGDRRVALIDHREAVARAPTIALELARTGKFDDVAAIERELVKVGYPADGIRSLERPIRVAINGACRVGRAIAELRQLTS